MTVLPRKPVDYAIKSIFRVVVPNNSIGDVTGPSEMAHYYLSSPVFEQA
jgi:hypothetical protein